MKKIITMMMCWVAILFTFTSCKDSNTSDLLLDVDARIEGIKVNGFEGMIDESKKTIEVSVSTDTDLKNLTIDALTISTGATCDYPVNTHFNGITPKALTVRNGDVYTIYTLTVKHDEAYFVTFTLNNKYAGTIDNVKHTVLFFVPLNEDVTVMQAVFTTNTGTEVTPKSGTQYDFTNPVTFTLVNRTATIQYVVTVVKDEMSQEPKAFIGNKSSVELLDNEARTACEWMLANVPNSRYVAVQDVQNGSVNLSDFKMIWCHLDFTDWPSYMWDTRDQFNSYWLHGGAILASRDGARYVNDVWRITKNQQGPNDAFGGDQTTTLTDNLGFSVAGHTEHPLYKDITIENDMIYLLGTGCTNTNRTLQWAIDWDPYFTMTGWETATGAKALASNQDNDPNRVTIAEVEPYEALKGFTCGRVIIIGTPAYEWYDANNVDNPYRENLIQMTKNAINYLCE